MAGNTKIDTKAAGGRSVMANGTIDKNTAISVGLLVTLVGGVIALLSFINTQFSELKQDYTTRFQAIELVLDRLSAKIVQFEYSTEDRWKGKDMKIWALEFQRDNPGINVPDPWTVQNSAQGARGNTGTSK